MLVLPGLISPCVQVRHYSPIRWVSTDAEAYFMGVGAAMAFRRLFQYITGANEGGESRAEAANQPPAVCLTQRVCVRAGVQMEMTAPVLVKIPEETKMWEPAVYTLNFPLPAAYQDKPPVPTNEKVSQAWQVGEGGGLMLSSTGCNLMVEDVLCELQLAQVLLSLTQEDTDMRRCCRPLSEREIVK